MENPIKDIRKWWFSIAMFVFREGHFLYGGPSKREPNAEDGALQAMINAKKALNGMHHGCICSWKGLPFPKFNIVHLKINMEHNIIMEVWFRSFSFLFMGDGCRFQPLICPGWLVHLKHGTKKEWDAELGPSPSFLRFQSLNFGKVNFWNKLACWKW